MEAVPVHIKALGEIGGAHLGDQRCQVNAQQPQPGAKGEVQHQIQHAAENGQIAPLPQKAHGSFKGIQHVGRRAEIKVQHQAGHQIHAQHPGLQLGAVAVKQPHKGGEQLEQAHRRDTADPEIGQMQLAEHLQLAAEGLLRHQIADAGPEGHREHGNDHDHLIDDFGVGGGIADQNGAQQRRNYQIVGGGEQLEGEVVQEHGTHIPEHPLHGLPGNGVRRLFPDERVQLVGLAGNDQVFGQPNDQLRHQRRHKVAGQQHHGALAQAGGHREHRVQVVDEVALLIRRDDAGLIGKEPVAAHRIEQKQQVDQIQVDGGGIVKIDQPVQHRHQAQPQKQDHPADNPVALLVKVHIALDGPGVLLGQWLIQINRDGRADPQLRQREEGQHAAEQAVHAHIFHAQVVNEHPLGEKRNENGGQLLNHAGHNGQH